MNKKIRLVLLPLSILSLVALLMGESGIAEAQTTTGLQGELAVYHVLEASCGNLPTKTLMDACGLVAALIQPFISGNQQLGADESEKILGLKPDFKCEDPGLTVAQQNQCTQACQKCVQAQQGLETAVAQNLDSITATFNEGCKTQLVDPEQKKCLSEVKSISDVVSLYLSFNQPLPVCSLLGYCTK